MTEQNKPLLPPQPLNIFYKTIVSFARATPLSRGRARRIILNRLKKKINHPIITEFRGVPFILNMDNTTEAKALFGKYNLQELRFMSENIPAQKAVFVDLGANSGFYTQNFLAACGQGSIALAIEPNPLMVKRIEDNFALLKQSNPAFNRQLIIEKCAVGKATQSIQLDLSGGYGGANITSEQNPHTITVQMMPLLDIIQKHPIDKIDVMKADIEGYEDRALIPFFEKADPSLFPQCIIIEHTSHNEWENDLFKLLADTGYKEIGKTRGNLLLKR